VAGLWHFVGGLAHHHRQHHHHQLGVDDFGDETPVPLKNTSAALQLSVFPMA
jgi:hypothetical protein